MKKLKLFLVLCLLIISISNSYSQYDPPIGRTSYYHLRMWGEGDRPGADSVNRNLIDIDLYLHNLNTYITNIADVFTLAISTERNRVNDSLSVHNVKLNNLTIRTADSIAAHLIRLNYLTYTTNIFQAWFYRLTDTLNMVVPRLNVSNVFTGSNEFQQIIIKDNGSSSLIWFRPDETNSAIIKVDKDTILSVYNNGISSHSLWNFNNTVDLLGGIKENNTVGHLISDFGNSVIVSLWASEHEGGAANIQLRAVPVTINGNTIYLLYYNP